MVQLISIELWSILKIKIILILAIFHNFQSQNVTLLLPIVVVVSPLEFVVSRKTFVKIVS